ncbi:MAG TPA: 3-oxoacyl-[acyl-carrier-protein] reductase [Deinococcales bacterium]|nr:3-oxoacyl-[acyl-carrier-protein] reductase [Deinococcales bacterium]
MTRRALVTGAGRGLGKAIALRLAGAGHHVAVHYGRSASEAQAVLEAIQAAGGQGVLVQGDLSTPEGAKAVAQEAAAKLGGLEILVNNAGITRDGLALRMSDADWEAVLATNLTAPFALTRAALRTMMSARWGRIVNVTSVVGLMGNPGQANYVSAKAGLVGLTRAIAKEYGGRGITCNAVAPGFIETDMTAKLPADLQDTYRKSIPAGRFGTPDDVAALVAFLASEEAGYVNGQTIAVDGGLHAG